MNAMTPQGIAVAIDTNVFEHILNPQENIDYHINGLLSQLQQDNARLVVDSGRRIRGEYNQQLTPIIRNGDDMRNEMQLLRYWILYAPEPDTVSVHDDRLMTAIRKVIVERSEGVDRIFVYVALKQGKTLITNDRRHIVNGPSRESKQGARRHRLLSDTRRLRPNGANILTSNEAHSQLPGL